MPVCGRMIRWLSLATFAPFSIVVGTPFLTDPKVIDELAERHGFSRDAVMSMLEPVTRGHGTMAQFDHPEFGGHGQWMGGGMTMVSDMFNDSLRSRVAALCADLSKLVGDNPAHAEPASLFVSPRASVSQLWWPAVLGVPSSTGSQNNVRYAYFASPRRLAIELHGEVTVYDTLDNQINRFSQQQSHAGSLTFHSQHGLVDVGTLPVISAGNVPMTEEAEGNSQAGVQSKAEAENPSGEYRLQRIAEAAYRRAEVRGFSPGYELDDWLAAQREVDGRSG